MLMFGAHNLPWFVALLQGKDDAELAHEDIMSPDLATISGWHPALRGIYGLLGRMVPLSCKLVYKPH